MTKELASQISDAFVALGWGHVIRVTANSYEISLDLTAMSGDQLLQLFGVIAPGGTPLPLQVSLTTAGLVIQ